MGLPTSSDTWSLITFPLVFATISAGFGGMSQFGYNSGVVNNPQETLKNWLNESSKIRGSELTSDQNDFYWTLIVSAFCVGGMIGGLMIGFLSDRFGRKGALLLNNCIAIVAGLLMGFSRAANSWEMLLFGRLVIGISAGLATGLVPLYLTEIAPAQLRGACGTVSQLVATITILVSQIMGLEYVLGTARYWDLLFGLCLLPAAFLLVTLPFCPESPSYTLIHRGRPEDAQRALCLLRRKADVSDEIDQIQEEYDEIKQAERVTWTDMFTKVHLRWPLIISSVIMMSQQLTGINAVIYYSNQTFSNAGMSKTGASNATLIMGTINVLTTVISLVLVDKVGRKTLHISGLCGMGVSAIVLTIALNFANVSATAGVIAVIAVVLFVVAFATGPGSIPWFYVNELFQHSAKSKASAIAVAVNWGGNFIVSLCFPLIEKAIGPYVFLIFTAFVIVFVVFTRRCAPETKNLTITEIQAVLRQRL